MLVPNFAQSWSCPAFTAFAIASANLVIIVSPLVYFIYN
ncbi:hypothetical protein SCAPIOD220001 [Staphylococcus capitis]|nr:hypothetical protein SCAPIOD220001 [Staphylococcus capitis]